MPSAQNNKLTSFNIRTFPLIIPICSSFWLSSSSSTAFEYWPFLFGVADLKPPSPLPLPLSPLFAPGYALKPASALKCDCEAYGELLLRPAP